ncbi:hypothetical protein K1719_043674 [Acacia pycnantha]|nr:hypothetical protein K1719_043674 [Acacia pycnantha]
MDSQKVNFAASESGSSTKDEVSSGFHIDDDRKDYVLEKASRSRHDKAFKTNNERVKNNIYPYREGCTRYANIN